MSSDRNWLTELRHSWPVIQRPLGTGLSGLSLPLRLSSGDVRIAVDSVGARRLLVPLGESEQMQVEPIEGPLLVDVLRYRFGDLMERFAEVACNRDDLFDLFDEVLVDVLQALRDDPQPPGSTVSEIVGRWRALLATRGHRVLPLTAQMSLIAELHVLGLSSGTGQVVAEAWRGPLREPHDIVFPGCAIEVKAIGATSDSVEIHGVEQLHPPGVPLALVMVEISESADGTSLPEFADRFLSTVDDPADGLRRLAAAGYAPLDSARYAHRFEIVSIEFTEVDETVPRIVPSSFASGATPSGITGVSYAVDLTALAPLVTRSETLLRNWVGIHP